MQTHGNLKHVELVLKIHTSMNTARSFKPKRFNAMHRTQCTETRPPTPQRKRNARLLTCRSNLLNRRKLDSLVDRTGHSLPCAPELEFPNQLGSFSINLVLSKPGFNCKITLGFSSLSPLSSFLSSNAPACTYLLAAPTHRASQLKSLLKQYLNTKDATLHAPALCVLVQKSHGLLQKHWQPLLNHMLLASFRAKALCTLCLF